MKAISAGLEFEISLSDLELRSLRNSPLEGNLRFREVNEETTRDIPFRLSYILGRNEGVEVNSTTDRNYMGKAERIEIILQDYLYQCLVEDGMCVDRFGIGGKVTITLNRKV